MNDDDEVELKNKIKQNRSEQMKKNKKNRST